MKTVRVGLTGAHGTGKTYIVEEIEKRAIEEGISIYKITSPTRYVKSLGFQNNQNLDFQNEFMCIALRVERQRKALLEENYSDVDKFLILADRVGLDELSYIQESISRQKRHHAESLGSESYEPIQQLENLYRLVKPWIYTETRDFWNQVFYKAPHPDYPPIVDEARPGELDYQRDIDRWMKLHWEKLPSDCKSQLHLDRDRSVEQVWGYVEDQFELGV